mmetsp:Transcript_16394/g.32057  ORF Transcript_16394/g.32057 Transcript_16394/m.32057 type:complete len:217 (+) Transcript_16394:84-734(+)
MRTSVRIWITLHCPPCLENNNVFSHGFSRGLRSEGIRDSLFGERECLLHLQFQFSVGHHSRKGILVLHVVFQHVERGVFESLVCSWDITDVPRRNANEGTAFLDDLFCSFEAFLFTNRVQHSVDVLQIRTLLPLFLTVVNDFVDAKRLDILHGPRGSRGRYIRPHGFRKLARQVANRTGGTQNQHLLAFFNPKGFQGLVSSRTDKGNACRFFKRKF